jgi:hypothetical protein
MVLTSVSFFNPCFRVLVIFGVSVISGFTTTGVTTTLGPYPER